MLRTPRAPRPSASTKRGIDAPELAQRCKVRSSPHTGWLSHGPEGGLIASKAAILAKAIVLSRRTSPLRLCTKVQLAGAMGALRASRQPDFWRRTPRYSSSERDIELRLQPRRGASHRALAAYGFDPACCFLHADAANRMSLTYDALELLRADKAKLAENVTKL